MVCRPPVFYVQADAGMGWAVVGPCAGYVMLDDAVAAAQHRQASQADTMAGGAPARRYRVVCAGRVMWSADGRDVPSQGGRAQ